MATRYWVGGSGTWDAVSTTNWSTTSGGSGGASAPTYADNVIFDTLSNATLYSVNCQQGFTGTGSISGTTLTITALTFSSGNTLAIGATINKNVSTLTQPTDTTYILGGTYIVNQLTGTPGGIGTYTVSISQTVTSTAISTSASCADLTVAAPLTGAVTFTSVNSNPSINIYGSMTLPATNMTWSATSEVIFCASTTGKTITTNGISIGASTNKCITFDGIGGGWTLGSALTSAFTSTGIRVNGGDFATGNFNITSTRLESLGVNTRSISLGSSTVTISTSTPVNLTSTGLTFNAGSSTLSLSANAFTFSGGGLTFYDVTFTNGTSTTSGKSISGSNTFRNLTFATKTSNTTVDQIIFSADQTITGILSLGNPTNYSNRRFLKSDILGTQRTLTVASTATFTAQDFRDIIIAGAAAPISGTSIGNAGNNSGVTFSTPRTVYWNLAAGGNWISSAWATTSGGTPVLNNLPLAQDTVIIQDTGLNSGATITAVFVVVGTLDFSSRTLPMNWTINTGANPLFYGPIYLNSAITINGTLGSRTGTATSIPYASGTSVGIHQSVLINIPNVNVDVSGNTVAVYTGSSVNIPSAITYIKGSEPFIFTGYSALLVSGNISVSASSPNLSTVANLNVPSGNIGIYSWMPNVYTGYAAKPNSADINVITLVPSVRTGIKLTIPNSVTYISGVTPKGVGVTSTRRIVFVTGDTSTNVVLIETDNSTQLNTTINGVVLNDFYNQTK